MSKSVPMYALDKVKTSLSIAAVVTVKLENRAKANNKKLAAYINSELAALVDDDPWTMEDERRVREIIDANYKKRLALIARRKAAKNNTKKGDR